MQGSATRIDTSARTVTVVLASNNKVSKGSSTLSGATNLSVSTATTRPPTSPASQTIDYRPSRASRNSVVQTIPYHALILATGTSAHSPLCSLHGPHEQTVAEIRDFRARLEKAQSVLIVGGGPSGVETAGQLATYFNWRPRWPLRPMKAQKPKPDPEPKPENGPGPDSEYTPPSPAPNSLRSRLSFITEFRSTTDKDETELSTSPMTPIVQVTFPTSPTTLTPPSPRTRKNNNLPLGLHPPPPQAIPQSLYQSL
jgi:hypothetical protein